MATVIIAVLISLQLLATAVTILSIGQKRDPIGPGSALIQFVLSGAIIMLLVQLLP